MYFKAIVVCPILTIAALGATAASRAEEPVPNIAGYVDLHHAWEHGEGNNYNPGPGPEYSWDARMVGGAARVAVGLGGNLFLQGDVWINKVVGEATSDSGATGHLNWRTEDGMGLIGIFGSVGQGGWNDGLDGTIGIEGVLNVDNWRFYGQAGLMRGLTDAAAAFEEQVIYWTLSTSYFFTPNLMVAGNIGGDRWSQNNGDSSPEWSFGGRLEYRPDGTPFSVYAGYQGYDYRSDYGASSDYDEGLVSVFVVGARVAFGSGTLRDTQNAVGLADLNPQYGEMFLR